MLKSESGFTLIEIILSLVLLIFIGTTLSSIFVNNIGVFQIINDKSDALNTAQNSINDSILENDGTSQSITIIFNEGQSDEVSFNIDGQLISKTENYNVENGSTPGITLEYFEVVVTE